LYPVEFSLLFVGKDEGTFVYIGRQLYLKIVAIAYCLAYVSFGSAKMAGKRKGLRLRFGRAGSRSLSLDLKVRRICGVIDGMKTDLYTKVVLTVIAVCPIGQLFHNVPVVTTARAESGKQLIQSVSVVGWSAGTLSVSGNVGVYNPQDTHGVTVPLAVKQTQAK
jgi:hypothetical protein